MSYPRFDNYSKRHGCCDDDMEKEKEPAVVYCCNNSGGANLADTLLLAQTLVSVKTIQEQVGENVCAKNCVLDENLVIEPTLKTADKPLGNWVASLNAMQGTNEITLGDQANIMLADFVDTRCVQKVCVQVIVFPNAIGNLSLLYNVNNNVLFIVLDVALVTPDDSVEYTTYCVELPKEAQQKNVKFQFSYTGQELGENAYGIKDFTLVSNIDSSEKTLFELVGCPCYPENETEPVETLFEGLCKTLTKLDNIETVSELIGQPCSAGTLQVNTLFEGACQTLTLINNLANDVKDIENAVTWKCNNINADLTVATAIGCPCNLSDDSQIDTLFNGLCRTVETLGFPIEDCKIDTVADGLCQIKDLMYTPDCDTQLYTCPDISIGEAVGCSLCKVQERIELTIYDGFNDGKWTVSKKTDIFIENSETTFDSAPYQTYMALEQTDSSTTTVFATAEITNPTGCNGVGLRVYIEYICKPNLTFDVYVQWIPDGGGSSSAITTLTPNDYETWTVVSNTTPFAFGTGGTIKILYNGTDNQQETVPYGIRNVFIEYLTPKSISEKIGCPCFENGVAPFDTLFDGLCQIKDSLVDPDCECAGSSKKDIDLLKFVEAPDSRIATQIINNFGFGFDPDPLPNYIAFFQNNQSQTAQITYNITADIPSNGCSLLSNSGKLVYSAIAGNGTNGGAAIPSNAAFAVIWNGDEIAQYDVLTTYEFTDFTISDLEIMPSNTLTFIYTRPIAAVPNDVFIQVGVRKITFSYDYSSKKSISEKIGCPTSVASNVLSGITATYKVNALQSIGFQTMNMSLTKGGAFPGLPTATVNLTKTSILITTITVLSTTNNNNLLAMLYLVDTSTAIISGPFQAPNIFSTTPNTAIELTNNQSTFDYNVFPTGTFLAVIQIYNMEAVPYYIASSVIYPEAITIS